MKKGYIVARDSRTVYCIKSEASLSFRLGNFKNLVLPKAVVVF